MWAAARCDALRVLHVVGVVGFGFGSVPGGGEHPFDCVFVMLRLPLANAKCMTFSL